MQSVAAQQEEAKKLGALLAKIEARALPKEYHGESHQEYVDRIMGGLTDDQRGHVGRLFNKRRKAEVGMENADAFFRPDSRLCCEGGAKHGDSRRAWPRYTVAAQAVRELDRGTRKAAQGDGIGQGHHQGDPIRKVRFVSL